METPKETERRGRPLTFTQVSRGYLANLIREHGIRGAQRSSVVPVSLRTLIKIGREYQIVLARGKRRHVA